MPVFNIRGIEVEFPFKPYDVQMDYMTKVIESLQTGNHAVLESPTGTGKTLCLLCATLAWRKSQVTLLKASEGCEADVEKLQEGLGAWGENPKSDPSAGSSVPKIIYASRTHSQLSQVVSELKRSSYGNQVVIAVLGSREQMCIHPEVSKQTNNQTMVHMCRNKVNKHICHFHNNVEDARKDGIFTKEVLDIEDLVLLGQKRNACPYYSSREVSKQPECGVIFTPYNYLLDRKSRRSHNLEIGGNVIIFDEAHNLEKQCEESASFDLTSLDIANCIEEVGDLLTAVTKMSETGTVAEGHEAGESSALSEFNKEELALMKSFFLAMEEHLDRIELPTTTKSRAEDGKFLFHFFAKVNLTFDTYEVLLELMDRISSYLSTLSNAFRTRGAALQKFSEVVKIAFSASGPPAAKGGADFGSFGPPRPSVEEISKFYRVHVCENAPGAGFGKKDLWKKKKGTLDAKPSRTISYWCFSPGYAMRDLVSAGVRNLILTSGTLSPIESFVSELQVDFPITLENGHVIDKHQIFVATLSKSLNGGPLESTYRTRSDHSQVVQLGYTVAEVAKASPGGMLVFFPSYTAMGHYVAAWRDNSEVMKSFEIVKQCTIEPRGKGELKSCIEKFYSDVKEPLGGALFAVCRGKVSEGLDFANNNGRVVVIIGIPFPPSHDPKVKLKMSFLDDLKKSGTPNVIQGQEWYRQQACRAVNQAIGRVIRHRYDYGAIVLCDQRYTRKEQLRELPKWIQCHVTQFDDCPRAIRRLRSFFCSIRQKENFRLRSLPASQKNGTDSSAAAAETSKSKRETVGATSGNALAFGGIKKLDMRGLPRMRDPDCHVPSRATRPIPTKLPDCLCDSSQSFARKRKRDEDGKGCTKTNLLSALDDCHDVMYEEEKPILGEAEAHRTSTHLLVMDRRMAENTKKKKIKLKKVNAVEEASRPTTSSKGRGPATDVNPSSSNTSAAATSTTIDERAVRFGPAKFYLDTVRDALSRPAYDAFKAAISTYKRSRDVASLVASLGDIFLDDVARHFLMRAFVRFALPEHQARFSELCQALTGEPCILEDPQKRP